MLIAKFLRDTKNAEYAEQHFMWEMDNEVTYCRNCNEEFSIMRRRHHCRDCGGIFCDSCCPVNPNSEAETKDRCCVGCEYGETPGENVRGAIEKLLNEKRDSRVPQRTAYNTLLQRGKSCNGLEDLSGSASPTTSSAPTQGYFELINKSKSFFCAKVVANSDGSMHDTLWEIPRPSYISVPPNSVVNCRFDASLANIELYILTSNRYPTPEGDLSGIICDAKVASPHVGSIKGNCGPAAKLSDCAAVANFRHFAAYRIHCTGKNVLLKFKGIETGPEPRLGNSVARIGVFSKLTKSMGMGSSSPSADSVAGGSSTVNSSANGDSMIDYDNTNITAAMITRKIASHTM